MLEYADDRPWPGSTGWSDAASRSALDVIAQGAEHMTGFSISCINVVHRGILRAVAMGATDEQRALLMDSHTPVGAMEDELEQADDWGRFRFVPSGRVADVREWGATFDVERAEGPDAWHSDDVLAAPIRDEQGRMVGLLSLDLPVSGRRPDAAGRDRLERYAALVEGAVLMALEHHEQQERITMARAARDVVAAATHDLSMQAVFAASAQALMSGFRARGVWLQTFDLNESHGAVHADTGVVRAVPPALMQVAERMAREAWDEKMIGVLARGRTTEGLEGPEHAADREAILTYLESIHVASILFVPLGAGAECLGCLVLSRSASGQQWTAVETEAARDIGKDLGRAILNARAFEREQRAVQELQALDSYKSQLVATLSHELKTPLASILGNLELIEDADPASDDGRRGIAAIGRGASRLVRVVDDLMLLAKVGDPGNQLISRPVDLAALVEEVVELTAPTARQRRITVRVREPHLRDRAADDGVPHLDSVVALGDAAELDRVISNLVVNALKYTPEGGRVDLEVSLEGDEAVFTCTDSGIGISDVDQARLFREFFRSADPAAQGQPGTGLGLAIVDRIVQRHHGRIEVSSSVGAGSTFRVRLPGVPTSPAPRGTHGSTERRTAEVAQP